MAGSSVLGEQNSTAQYGEITGCATTSAQRPRSCSVPCRFKGAEPVAEKQDQGLRWSLLADGKEKQTDEPKDKWRLGAALKAKDALKTLGNELTVAELAAKYQLHPDQITPGRSGCFDGGCRHPQRDRRGGEPGDWRYRARGQDRSAHGEAEFFITEGGPDDEAAKRVAMIDRGWTATGFNAYTADGLEALGPKPKTSRPAAQHRIHSYITCSAAWRSIGRPRCGLQTPRTPDRLGLFYLVVILGWCSR
jgi:hypothetical protein